MRALESGSTEPGEFIFDDETPFRDSATGEYTNLADADELEPELPIDDLNELAAGLEPASEVLQARTNEWLAAQRRIGSHELREAWNSVLLSSLLAGIELPEAPEDFVTGFATDLLKDIAERVEPARVQEHRRAIEQVLEHLEAEPTLMGAALRKHASGLIGRERVSKVVPPTRATGDRGDRI